MRPHICRIQPHSLLTLPHCLVQAPKTHERSCPVSPASCIVRRDRDRPVIQAQRLCKIPSFILLVTDPLHLFRIQTRHCPLHHHCFPCKLYISHNLSPQLPTSNTLHYIPKPVIARPRAQHIAPRRAPARHAHLPDLPRRADVSTRKQIGPIWRIRRTPTREYQWRAGGIRSPVAGFGISSTWGAIKGPQELARVISKLGSFRPRRTGATGGGRVEQGCGRGEGRCGSQKRNGGTQIELFEIGLVGAFAAQCSVKTRG